MATSKYCTHMIILINDLFACFFFQQKDPELQEIDRGKWWIVFEELQKLLRHAASLSYRKKTITKEQKEKYFMSGKNA